MVNLKIRLKRSFHLKSFKGNQCNGLKQKFGFLPREKLLDAVIENMTERLTSRNTEVASLVSLVESVQWEFDEIT